MNTASSKRGSSLNTLPAAPAKPLTPTPRRINEDQPAKQTVFIPRRVHHRLKEICLARNISQQQIFMAALDRWLIEEGIGSIAEIEGQPKDG